MRERSVEGRQEAIDQKGSFGGEGGVAGSQEAINKQSSCCGERCPVAGVGDDLADVEDLGVHQAGTVPVHEGVPFLQLPGVSWDGVGEDQVGAG